MSLQLPDPTTVVPRFDRKRRRRPRAARKPPSPATTFILFGSSVIDLHVAPEVVVELLDDGELLDRTSGHFYFQPTGSLEAATMCELASRAAAVVTNFDELNKLATSAGIA